MPLPEDPFRDAPSLRSRAVLITGGGIVTLTSIDEEW